MIVYRMEDAKGVGVYFTKTRLGSKFQNKFFHSVQRHPVSGYFRVPDWWETTSGLHGFDSWYKAARWFGFWGEPAISFYQKARWRMKAYDVPEDRVLVIDDKQLVFDESVAELVTDRIDLSLLLDRFAQPVL